MKKIRSIVILALMLVVFGCASASNVKEKNENVLGYYKGDLYCGYGAKVTNQEIVNTAIKLDPTKISKKVMDIKWPVSKEIFLFTEKESEYEGGFYTGIKENGGPKFTWFAKKISVNSLYDLAVNVGWRKPVFITYNNRTIPLKAYEDENGEIKSAIGVENVNNPIDVLVSTLDDADIWYFATVDERNPVRAEYYKLAAFSVAVGQCALAQAEANGFLLNNIAKLTGVKVALEEDLNNSDVELTSKEIKAIQSKIKELDKTIKNNIKINRDLTGSIAGAMVGVVGQGLELTKKSLSSNIEIFNTWYFTKEGKEYLAFNKTLKEIAKTNFQYGKDALKASKAKLKKQKAQLDAILKDVD